MKDRNKSKLTPSKPVPTAESSEEEEIVDNQSVENDSEMEADEMIENEDQIEDNNSEVELLSNSSNEAQVKKKKKGIIYISSIPKFMNVTILRELLGEYARIGRIFLQPGKLTSKDQFFPFFN